jgi:streptomycin 6-kinase
MGNFPDNLRGRWAISEATSIADTKSSLVYRVERYEAQGAIVKILKPGGMNELPGMAFLEWRNGSGAVRLIDRHLHACLIEDAGDQLLRDYHRQFGDEKATDIVLDVLGGLHATSPDVPPADLVSLRQHFSSLFDKAQHQADPALAEILRWAAALAEDLLHRQTDIRPLHGDLHHDNIIGAGLRGWLAIDPQGLIGDPAYDVANVFGNPLGAARDILDPSRIKTLAKRFSAAISCSKTKILRYAAAHAGLSICWSLDDSGSAEAQENIAERLAFAGIVRRMLEESEA